MAVWISTLHRHTFRRRHTTPLLWSSEPTVSVCECTSAAYHACVITSKKAPLKTDLSHCGRQCQRRREQAAALGSHVSSCVCVWGGDLGINHTVKNTQKRGKRQQRRTACLFSSVDIVHTQKKHEPIKIRCAGVVSSPQIREGKKVILSS